MKWLLAGISFAALVALAAGTASLRAENSIRRNRCAKRLAEMNDRLVEFRRLEADLLDSASSWRLAEMHWRHLLDEARRRQGRAL